MIKNKMHERSELFKKINPELGGWKESLYYGLYPLIKKDAIFSKLPYLLGNRAKINNFDATLFLFKSALILPIMYFWRLSLTRIEKKYYAIKFPDAYTLQNVKDESFDYLFVINTRDHIITALPVLENLDKTSKNLIITFRSVFDSYRADFNKLKNSKVILFEYELKNLPPTKYLELVAESREKCKLLKSQQLPSDASRLIKVDSNFISYHLKTELIQYYLFKNIFETFDIKGTIAIVFTTAFEISKEKEIPTFVLQHGVGAKGHGHPYVSDYWFAFDEISKKELDIWLDSTVTVLPMGLPRFEYLKNNFSLKRDMERFGDTINMHGYNKIVTYVGGAVAGPITFQALKSLRAVLPDNVNLIIKQHPRIRLDKLNLKMELEKILTPNELKNTAFLTDEIDFYDLLAHSDIIITRESTGMFEAIAVDIPVIQINFETDEIPDVVNLSSYGWKEPINDIDVLVEEVTSLIADEKCYKAVIKRQKILQGNLLKNFGASGLEIAATIDKICRK